MCVICIQKTWLNIEKVSSFIYMKLQPSTLFEEKLLCSLSCRKNTFTNNVWYFPSIIFFGRNILNSSHCFSMNSLDTTFDFQFCSFCKSKPKCRNKYRKSDTENGARIDCAFESENYPNERKYHQMRYILERNQQLAIYNSVACWTIHLLMHSTRAPNSPHFLSICVKNRGGRKMRDNEAITCFSVFICSTPS